ncbi:hypothetical protein LMG3410_02106 [Achromobacter aegrifaciens]|uniref:hypothetical protein n=1 Tax=Achromobacter aegrifaciens TaxID=1287736 RepID=UPI0014655983|nr:hypothetical protein [Achromobacter aegrifaciens]CAB3857521.1 hypothetical protein LMG3410_02106 [Achromobacter aegrifaciens]
MTDHTTAAQAADTNPLSNEHVNAVIQRHGYQSPEAVCARLYQWIGLHGEENGVTLLIYEAHKALSQLRAPVAGEAQPVAWFIDWPDEPQLGHYIAESPADYGRSRPLVFADAAAQASEAVRPDADALDLARAGMELHSPGMPEHTVCAKLVRIAAALSAQPGAQKEQSDA